VNAGCRQRPSGFLEGDMPLNYCGLSQGFDIWVCCNLFLSISKVFASKPKYRGPEHIIGSYRLEENQMATAGKTVDYDAIGGDSSFS
jgi:hypothetical protein